MKTLESIIKNLDPITAITLIFILLVIIMYLIRKLKKAQDELKNGNDLNNLCGNYPGSIETMGTDVITNNKNAVFELINNYTPSSCDTRSVNFNLETLKEFIFHAERKINNYCADNQGTIKPVLGMRFYYARYSNVQGSPSYPPNSSQHSQNYITACQERHTLVMVPTYKNSDGIDIDFNVLDPSFELNMGASYLGIASGIPATGLNHGSLYPPMN